MLPIIGKIYYDKKKPKRLVKVKGFDDPVDGTLFNNGIVRFVRCDSAGNEQKPHPHNWRLVWQFGDHFVAYTQGA